MKNSIVDEYLQSSTLSDSGCVLNSVSNIAIRRIIGSCQVQEDILHGHDVTEPVQ
jgi:hypothetical protein